MLGRLTSRLLLGRELLLESEDQGPDVPREEPGNDGLSVHLTRQHMRTVSRMASTGGTEDIRPFLTAPSRMGLRSLS